MRVLIVDDERLIADDLEHEVQALLGEGTVVVSTTEPLHAARLAERIEFDVALLDIDMPSMDGLNLARRIIAANPAVNIIFVTGYEDYALEAHDLYCSAYLVKPVGRRKLQRAFENLRKPFLDLPENFSAEHYSGEAVIGKHIEHYREQRGLSRQELADYMGVARQTIFRWEHGERMPDVLTFLRLARLLGVSVEKLLGAPSESDTTPPPPEA